MVLTMTPPSSVPKDNFAPESSETGRINLSSYNNSWYSPGASTLVQVIWYFVNCFVFRNPIFVLSHPKSHLLRLFGADVGDGVVIKPGTSIKYPWNLAIGAHSWIGEGVWLDSLAHIRIGKNCCISQGAYLCTGNHDWTDPAFGLRIGEITLEDGTWVGAKSVVLPGVTMGSHSILTAGSVLSACTTPYGIYSGNPATRIKNRSVRSS